MNEQQVIVCTDAAANFLGIFDLSIAPPLLYYSYIPIIVISLILGFFVIFKSNFSYISKIFFLMTALFSAFVVNELLQWLIVPVGIYYFMWSLGLLLNFLVIITLFYFVYLFIEKNDLPFKYKLVLTFATLPIVVFFPTKFNLVAFDPDWCGAITGVLWNYMYFMEVLCATGLIVWGIRLYVRYKLNKSIELLPSVYLLFGSSAFLAIYFASYYFADLTGVYGVNLIGPLGMLLFITVLSYLIVRFHVFNIKLLGAQALVITLLVLVGSLLFIVETTPTKLVAGATLIFISITGYFLIRSVKKEVQQREEIAKLADTLAKANDRLRVLDKMKSEFVSIASHQLRSPLTSIRGYASMLAEGSYGKLPAKAKEVAGRIAESSKYMALSVEDYLNVSRIEAGNMKYEMSDFNLKDVAQKIVDELRPGAIKKGLILVFRSDCDGSCSTHADIGKVRQVIMNLLDNAMKYTPKGTITVVAHDDVDTMKMCITIQDTGVGMSADTLEGVFEKFVRAKNANSVNVTGTGLGLYVAKKMITDMGGRVWAESEGEGKGSTFHIELPLIAGKSLMR